MACLTGAMKTCLVLSMSFTFIYTAYLAIQNLQSSLNQEANLGVTSLCVLYATIILFGIPAPAIIKALSPKRVLVIAWIIHCIYTASNFYPTWATLIPSSALLGAIAGPMWTSQGIYITAAGESHAAQTSHAQKDYSKYVHAVLSKFNGIFFMFYELTQITGNLISSLVLSQGSYNATADSESESSMVCGPDDCPSSSTSGNVTSSSIEEPKSSVIYIMLSIFLGCNVCGLLLTLFYLPAEPDALPRTRSRSLPTDNRLATSTSNPHASTSSIPSSSSTSPGTYHDLCQCLSMLGDTRMLLLMPLFAGQAMAVGVLYADYTKAYISCSLGVRWVGYVMASYGLCCAVLALSINTVAARRLGRVALFVIAVLVDIASLLAMLFWHPHKDDSVTIYFIVPAISGISEGTMQAQFNTLVGQVFSSKVTPAFATYHTTKAASFTVTFALSNFVCLRERLYLAIGLYVVGLIGYLITEFRLRQNYKQVRLDNTEEERHNSGEIQQEKRNGPV